MTDWRCAICADTLPDADPECMVLEADRVGREDRQIFRVHVECFRSVLFENFPLGSVFEPADSLGSDECD